MAIQLPFGVREGELTHISGVERGLKCDCVCPSCEEQLIARKGNKTVHHFAHYKNANCEGSVETALHWAAKNLLAEEKRVRLPDTCVQFNSFREPFRLCKSKTLEFDNVWLETASEDVVPDILIEKNGRRLAVEIKVSHEVDEEKRDKMRSQQLSVLEIDLADLEQPLTESLLRSILIEGTQHKEWLYNHRARRYRERLMLAARRKMIQDTGMDMYVRECPRAYRSNGSGHYALVVDDCWHCRHCVHHDREKGVIYCAANITDLMH